MNISLSSAASVASTTPATAMTPTSPSSSSSSSTAVSGSGEHHHGHGHGGGGMSEAILQALDASGVSTTAAPTSIASGSASQVGQSVQQFMTDLVQTAGAAQTGSNGSAGSQPYAGLQNGIQSLIANLQSGTSSAALSGLESDFNNMVSAMGSTGSSAMGTPSLQSFLSNLEQAMQGQASPSPIGNNVTTRA